MSNNIGAFRSPKRKRGKSGKVRAKLRHSKPSVLSSIIQENRRTSLNFDEENDNWGLFEVESTERLSSSELETRESKLVCYEEDKAKTEKDTKEEEKDVKEEEESDEEKLVKIKFVGNILLNAGLEAYMQSPARGSKTAQQIEPILRQYVKFLLWTYSICKKRTFGCENDILSWIKQLTQYKFDMLDQYISHMCQTHKAGTLLHHLDGISLVTKWFGRYSKSMPKAFRMSRSGNKDMLDEISSLRSSLKKTVQQEKAEHTMEDVRNFYYINIILLSLQTLYVFN